MDFCYSPPGRVKVDSCCLPSKWAKNQDGLLLLPPERVKMGCCCLPLDRFKITVNSKKETNSRVKNGPRFKMSQGSRWASVFTPCKSQYDPSVKMGWCHLPPKRVKLTENTKKETNSKVKMGQGSRCSSVIYPLKESKWAAAVYPLTKSN